MGNVHCFHSKNFQHSEHLAYKCNNDLVLLKNIWLAFIQIVNANMFSVLSKLLTKDSLFIKKNILRRASTSNCLVSHGHNIQLYNLKNISIFLNFRTDKKWLETNFQDTIIGVHLVANLAPGPLRRWTFDSHTKYSLFFSNNK